MAYYQETGGPLRKYGEISHFRQPYKDYTTLAGFGDVPTSYTSDAVANIWYVNDPSLAAYLPSLGVQLITQPGFDAAVALIDTGGQMPDPNAQAVIQQYVLAGYAAILTSSNFTTDKGNQYGLIIVFTKDPQLVADMCGTGSANKLSAVLQMPPDIGLKASAIAAKQDPNAQQQQQPKILPISILLPGTNISSSSLVDKTSKLGPLGTAIVVLAMVGVGYYGWKHLKKRRKTS